MTTAAAKTIDGTKAFRIGVAEEAILQALLRYHYLNAEQLTTLLFSPNSLAYVQKKLKGLGEHGFCLHGYDLRGAPNGRARYAWTVARKGLNYLAAQGMDVKERFHAGEAANVRTIFLAHTFAVNDFFISLERLCKQFSNLVSFNVFDDFVSERTIKRKPPCVVIHLGEAGKRKPVRKPVITDGFVMLRLGGRGRMPLAPEIDRGTEAQGRWRQKVAALVAFASAPSEEVAGADGNTRRVTALEKHFGVSTVTIPVLTTEGARRADDLQRWTEAELSELGRTDEGDMFLFTAGRPDRESPEDLFLRRRWTYAFGQDLEPLIPVGQGDG